MITPEARKRLADLMEQRLVDLRLTWREVAETGDISYEALRAARNGTGDIRRTTQAGIDDGLRWERGSVGRVLAGGDPVPLDAPPAPPPRREIDFSGGDQEALRPYKQQVLAEVYASVGLAGRFAAGHLPDLAGVPGAEETLAMLPASRRPFRAAPHEASTWDDENLMPGERVTIIARMRQLWDQAAEAESRRTGLTSGFPLVSVAGRTVRASH